MTLAWIIPVRNEKEIKGAVRLGFSLKRVKSCGVVVAMVNPSLLETWEIAGQNAVEMTLVAPKMDHKIETPFQDSSSLVALQKLTSFSKVICLLPGLYCVRQSDYLFDEFMEKDGILVEDHSGLVCALGLRPGGNLDIANILEWKQKFGKTLKIETIKTLEKLEASGSDIVYLSADVSPLNMSNLNWNPRERNWVAVVGMSCRFPGANSLEEYWDLLEKGRCTSSRPSANRVEWSSGKISNSSYANFLNCPIDQFDAGFFKLTPSEAVFTDPQARLLLQVSWEALENAAINPDTLRGSPTGVFHGSWLQEYKEALNQNSSASNAQFLRKYLGNSFGSTAAKLSYFYGWTGPNVATESGCSSSLVALHLAIQSLQRRECPLAMVTGANLILQMDEEQKVLWAKDGISRSFDGGADGYGRAEGVAVLLLKRYSDALRDNDRIHGVILGSAVAQEGMSPSFGQPTVESEAKVMRMALRQSGITVDEVDCLEAHSTGTQVGDPIEAAAIYEVYRDRKSTRPLWIASGKTNIGHTESVSGLAGVIKMLLALKHREIPRHLHMQNTNPRVNFSRIGGIIPVVSQPWQRCEERPRIAGVSSFGITGTDAHVLIQEAPTMDIIKHGTSSKFSEILGVSAKSRQSLDDLLTLYKEHLSPENLVDSCFTANTGHSHSLGFRAALILNSAAEIIKEVNSTQVKTAPPKICFTFPGLVGQMGFEQARQLYETCPHFQRSMNHCNQIWRAMALSSQLTLTEVLYKIWPLEEVKPWSWYCCVLAVQCSLSHLWMWWGIQPDVVMGLCMGEVTAAVLSGIITLEDGYQILRSCEYLNEAQEGAMLAVKAGKETVCEIIKEIQAQNPEIEMDIATVNSPGQTVVAATAQNLASFKDICMAKGIKFQQLRVDFAAHSHFVEEALQKAERNLFQNIKYSSPSIPMISSLTGATIKEGDIDGKFWRRLFREPVHYMKACKTSQEMQCEVYLEMGLSLALTALTQENLATGNSPAICVASLGKSKSDLQELWSSLGEMYVAGGNINWENIYKNDKTRRKIDLPLYPFQRKSFWFEKSKQVTCPDFQNLCTVDTGNPLLGYEISNCTRSVIFCACLDETATVAGISDHLIGGHVVFPAAAYLEMILAAAAHIRIKSDKICVKIEDFKIKRPLVLQQQKSWLQTVLTQQDSEGKGKVRVEIYSRKEQAELWQLHVTALLSTVNFPTNISKDNFPVDIEEMNQNLEEFYESLAHVGLQYGPKFRMLKGRSTGGVFHVDAPKHVEAFMLHPILADAIIQAFIFCSVPKLNKLFVPVQIGSVVVNAEAMKKVKTTDRLFIKCEESTVILFYNESTVLAVMDNVKLTPTSVENILSFAINTNSGIPNIYDIMWQSTELMSQSQEINTDKNIWALFHDHKSYSILPKLVYKLQKLDRQMTCFEIEEIFNNCSTIRTLLRNENLEGIIYCVLDNYENAKSILEPLLNLSQELIMSHREINDKRTKLCLVTRNCWKFLEDGESPLQCSFVGTLWGFMRTLIHEQPAILAKSIDFSTADIEVLVFELLASDHESEICYRANKRLCRRLVLSNVSKANTVLDIPRNGKFRVEFPKSKLLEDLKYLPEIKNLHLGENEVEITVHCSSLNFKDVLSILAADSVFKDMQLLGLDYAGVISGVGKGVTRWSVGDRVFGCNFKERIVCSHTRVDQNLVSKIPEYLTFSEAAALPTVFITAYYCMMHVAQLKSGQVMLVHAASGGVGLMAIQIAKILGVQVIGTAGSKRKRALLSRLGVTHIYSSRDTNFREQIKRDFAQEQHVDMVLNCLTGPGFKEASLDLVRDGGHFVEISKLDIWTESQVKALRPEVHYRIVNALNFSISLYMELMENLCQLFNSGKLISLPLSVFPAKNLVQALKFLQKAQHVGKVVLEMPLYDQKLFNGRSTYFISGGTGTIGLAIATWMVNQGAKYLVLASRSNPSDKILEILENLRKNQDCNIMCRQLDISDYQQCKMLFQAIGQKFPPIRGIQHCAGILEDKLIQNLTWADFDSVFKAKVAGTWNLHNVSIEMNLPLEFFVMHSSMCATFGNMGQANYTSANVFMDSLAHYRKFLGLPALSINWGLWEKGLAERKNVSFLGHFSMENGIQTLEKLLRESRTTSGKSVIVAGIFKQIEILKRVPNFEHTLFDHLKHQNNTAKQLPNISDVIKPKRFSTLYSELISAEERFDLVKIHVIKVVCETLGHQERDLRENMTLSDMGMDSLMSIELSNKLNVETETYVDVQGNNTVSEICCIVHKLMEKHPKRTQ